MIDLHEQDEWQVLLGSGQFSKHMLNVSIIGPEALKELAGEQQHEVETFLQFGHQQN